MNKTAILVSCVLGVLTGGLIIILLRVGNPSMCCCADPSAIIFGSLLGAFLGPANYRVLPTTKLNLGLGAVHAITVSAFALFTVWIALLVTSPETMGRYVSDYWESMEPGIKQVEEQLKEQGDDDDQVEKMIKGYRQFFEELQTDPRQARNWVVAPMAIHTMFLAPLLGLLGAWLGLAVFRSSIERKEREDGGNDFGDRMDPPEQPKPWWEEKK